MKNSEKETFIGILSQKWPHLNFTQRSDDKASYLVTINVDSLVSEFKGMFPNTQFTETVKKNKKSLPNINIQESDIQKYAQQHHNDKNAPFPEPKETSEEERIAGERAVKKLLSHAGGNKDNPYEFPDNLLGVVLPDELHKDIPRKHLYAALKKSKKTLIKLLEETNKHTEKTTPTQSEVRELFQYYLNFHINWEESKKSPLFPHAVPTPAIMIALFKSDAERKLHETHNKLVDPEKYDIKPHWAQKKYGDMIFNENRGNKWDKAIFEINKDFDNKQIQLVEKSKNSILLRALKEELTRHDCEVKVDNRDSQSQNKRWYKKLLCQTAEDIDKTYPCDITIYQDQTQLLTIHISKEGHNKNAFFNYNENLAPEIKQSIINAFIITNKVGKDFFAQNNYLVDTKIREVREKLYSVQEPTSNCIFSQCASLCYRQKLDKDREKNGVELAVSNEGVSAPAVKIN